MRVRPQKSTYNLMSAYRSFALAAAALQIVLVTSLADQFLSYIILGSLGLYTLIRVFLHRYRAFREGYLWLGVDVVLCALPLFLTGGIMSPFLFYSLCPIIYAALIFPRLVAVGCASLVSISLMASFFTSNQSQINLSFLGTYIIACFLVAIMPYMTNLNSYRHVEEDAALQERKKLARQLHDTVVQALAYVNLKARLVTDTLAKGDLKRSLNELEQMKESLDSAYEEVRRTIETLGRTSPRTVDFVPALSHQIREFERKSNLRSLLSVSGDELKLSPLAADELLHIVGEAMVNARNHAQATTLEVWVNSNGNWVGVTIKDDGCGFDMSAYYRGETAQNHHGITIMRERAESLGGTLVITSAPGNGTKVEVTVPPG